MIRERDSSPDISMEMASEPLLFVTSSCEGFGHVSRVVAIAQAWNSERQLTFVAHPNAHEFMGQVSRDGLNHTILPLQEEYPPKPDHEFRLNNPALFESLETTPVVVNDFLERTPFIAEAARMREQPPHVVGTYHSIFGYHDEDPNVQDYLQRYRAIAGSLDMLFVSEPRTTHAKPYQLDTGTVVVHCDPIVRKPNRDAAEVKAALGIDPEDEFIYVQGGMSGCSELGDFYKSLQGMGLRGLKLVLAPFKGSDKRPVEAQDNVIFMNKGWMDGQNIINACAGVISKPGMGILGEAVAHNKPLLLLGKGVSERKIKYSMLAEILGPLPFRLDLERSVESQILEWHDASADITQRFSTISCEGAQTVVSMLHELAQSESVPKSIAS